MPPISCRRLSSRRLLLYAVALNVLAATLKGGCLDAVGHTLQGHSFLNILGEVCFFARDLAQRNATTGTSGAY